MAGVRIHSRTQALTIVDDEVISRRIKLDFEPEADNGSATVRLRGLRCGSVACWRCGRCLGQRRLQHTVQRHKRDVIPARTETVYLRADRHGFLASALLLSLVTTGLAVTGWAFLRKHATGDTGSLALIVPALLAAFLVRPSEHALAGAMLESTRWALTVTVVATIALPAPAGTWRRRSATPRQDRVRFRSAKAA